MTDLIKLMQRFLFVYSIALFALGFIIGVAFKSSDGPPRRDYPAQYEPDNSSLTINRRA